MLPCKILYICNRSWNKSAWKYDPPLIKMGPACALFNLERQTLLIYSLSSFYGRVFVPRRQISTTIGWTDKKCGIHGPHRWNLNVKSSNTCQTEDVCIRLEDSCTPNVTSCSYAELLYRTQRCITNSQPWWEITIIIPDCVLRFQQRLIAFSVGHHP